MLLECNDNRLVVAVSRTTTDHTVDKASAMRTTKHGPVGTTAMESWVGDSAYRKRKAKSATAAPNVVRIGVTDGDDDDDDDEWNPCSLSDQEEV